MLPDYQPADYYLLLSYYLRLLTTLITYEGITYIHFLPTFFGFLSKKKKKSSLQESIICETTVIYLLWFHERISWKHDYEMMICKINLTKTRKKLLHLDQLTRLFAWKLYLFQQKSKEIRNWKTEKLFVLWLNEDAVLIYTYCIFIR